MVKTRKTRKAIEEPDIVEELEEDEEVEEEEEEEVVENYTPPPPVKSEPPKAIPKVVAPPAPPKEFTAILQDAVSLTLAGIKFTKNEPVKVPMAHLKMIRDHGWFRVIA